MNKVTMLFVLLFMNFVPTLFANTVYITNMTGCQYNFRFSDGTYVGLAAGASIAHNSASATVPIVWANIDNGLGSPFEVFDVGHPSTGFSGFITSANNYNCVNLSAPPAPYNVNWSQPTLTGPVFVNIF